jgi:hypothetical protein
LFGIQGTACSIGPAGSASDGFGWLALVAPMLWLAVRRRS